ncbi:MAG: response regulator [Candidatus Sericytochromatia bacterium]|nr:response regulator [Candidatus Sericytochromatia bacterium]
MKKIIIIDDDIINLKSISINLKLRNYLIFESNNGKKGLEIIKKELPNLIICDLYMPSLNCIELIEEMRRNSLNIPIIIISDNDSSEQIKKVINAGSSSYFKKPFDLELLITKAESLVK